MSLFLSRICVLIYHIASTTYPNNHKVCVAVKGGFLQSTKSTRNPFFNHESILIFEWPYEMQSFLSCVLLDNIKIILREMDISMSSYLTYKRLNYMLIHKSCYHRFQKKDEETLQTSMEALLVFPRIIVLSSSSLISFSDRVLSFILFQRLCFFSS